MDLAIKKIELINWLTKQDEIMINKIDDLRKSSVISNYKARMYEDVEIKIGRSEDDIESGRVHDQDSVEDYFKKKFNQ